MRTFALLFAVACCGIVPVCVEAAEAQAQPAEPRQLLVRDLERFLREMEARVAALEKRLTELTEQNRALRAEIERLRRSRATHPPEALKAWGAEIAGLVVSKVRPGSVAEKLGLKEGDRIVAVGGKRDRLTERLKEALGEGEPGAVQLTVVREGREHTIPPGTGVRLGLLVGEGPQGALEVWEVEEGFAGQVAGIEKGDILLGCNSKKLKTLEDLEQALSGVKSPQRLELLWRRKDRTFRAVVVASGRRAEAKLLSRSELSQRAAKAAGNQGQVGKAALGLLCRETEGGLLVVGVLKGSRAEKAGLRPGDLLLRCGGTPLKRLEDLRALFAGEQGERIFEVRSPEGKERRVKVAAGAGKAVPQEKPAGKPQPVPGKTPPQGRPFLGIEVVEEEDHLVVTNVVAGGPSQGKLKTGDVIASVQGRPVRNLQDMREALKKLQVGKAATLKIFRGGQKRTVVIVPAGK